MASKRWTRRQLLRRTGVGLAGLAAGMTLLEACGAPAPSPTAAPAAAPKAAATTAAAPAAAATKAPSGAAATTAPAPAATTAAKPAAAATTAPAPATSPKRQEAVIVFAARLATLDPPMHTSRDSQVLQWQVMDSLLMRDPKTLEIGPWLASSYKNLNDTTWEFQLRKDVKWHNGDTLTAADVKFTFDRIVDPANKATLRTQFDWVKQIDIKDDFSFVLTTAYPFPLTVERLAVLQISNKKYTEAKGNAFVALNPMGTGAYKWVEGKLEDKIILEANPNYWGPVKPKIPRVVFRIIPEVATYMAELLAGNVHVVPRIVPPEQVPTIKSSKTAKVQTAPSVRMYFITMDAIGRASKTPFMDKRVRQAVNYAIDRKAIVENVMGGMATPSEIPVSPVAFKDDTIKGYPYDPAKAKALLKEAGVPTPFETLLNFGSKNVSVQEAIMGYLEEVGFKINLKDYSATSATLTDLRQQGKAEGINSNDWGGKGTFDADPWLYEWFWSGAINTYGNSPEVDKLLVEAHTIMDQNKRRANYQAALKIIVEEAWSVPLYAGWVIDGVAKDLEHLTVADEFTRMWESYWTA